MSFLYYVPSQSVKVPEELSYAFEKPPVTSQVLANGPDGGAGTLFGGGAYHQDIHRLRIDRSAQSWQPYPGSKFWIGWYCKQLPGPADLVRSSTVQGIHIPLGDERDWEIPIARACYQLPNGNLAPICSLPTVMQLNENREWVSGSVVRKYRDLYEIAEKWWGFLMQALADKPEGDDTAEVELTTAEAASWCVTVLQTNYRVTDVEVSMLELLNDTTRGEILNALVDLHTWQERIKKKELSQSESTSFAAGNAA